jgi:hypothetical protein
MIPSFRVQNFKCFEDLSLEGLGRVNLIAGANNVGKTALLEALLLDGRRDFAAAVLEILTQRNQSGHPTISSNVREWFFDDAKPVRLNGAFAMDDKKGPGIVRVRDGRIQELLFSDQLQRLEQLRLADSMQFPDSLAIWLSGLDAEKRDKYWDHLLIEGDQDRISDFVRIVLPSVERLGLLADGGKFRQPYCSVSGERFRLSRLGTGMDRLFGLGFGLNFARGNRLLIDEFETGLHYSILGRIWRSVFETAKALDVQVFATTHSSDCIRTFARVAEEHEEEGKYFRLDTNLGKLRAVSLNEEELAFATEAGMEVR